MTTYFKTWVILPMVLLFYAGVHSQTPNNKIDSLKKLTLQKDLSDTLRIQAWIHLSKEMVRVRHPESLEKLQQLRKVGQALNSKYLIGHYNLQSAAYHYLNQNLNAALRFVEKAIDIFEKSKHQPDLVDAYNSEGLIYQSYQTWTRSLQSYQKALMFCRALKDTNRQYIIISNIALIHQSNKDYLKAIEYHKKSEKYYIQNKDTATLANILNNLGTCYKELGENTLAEKYYIDAIANIKKVRNSFYECIYIGQLSDLYIKQKKHGKALSNLKKAETLIKQHDLKELRPYLYQGYGEYYLGIKNYPQSEIYLQKATRLAAFTKDIEFDLEVNNLLFQLKQNQGNLAEALKYYQQYAHLKDSLYDSEKTNQLTRWESFYDAENKEKENQSLKAEKARQKLLIQNQWITSIAIGVFSILLLIILFILLRAYQVSKKLSNDLSKKNQEITQGNEKLIEVIQVKDKIFSIIAHDLRGPISSLNQVLKLLKQDILSIDEFKNILNKLLKQGENTEDLIENLLFWAKNQMEGICPVPKEIDLEKLTLGIFELYQSTAIQKDIDLKLQSAHTIQVYADPEMLKLVLRNIINNAIKYSYQGSQINVKLENDTAIGLVRISIKDEGIGIPAELQAQLFSVNIQSRNGTNQEKGTGLGLMLVKDFVETMGGEILVASKLNQGTSFHISLPSTAPLDSN